MATETAAGAGWGFQKGRSPFCPARERFIEERRRITKIAQN
ncbi:hypothetical protein BREVNS_2057 [Brevinematales bacterium NS]|nr:hypothetical protein BREVNS_2057 [Brevinematales bacterium NS]